MLAFCGWGYASILQCCLVDDAVKRDTAVVKVGENIFFSLKLGFVLRATVKEKMSRFNYKSLKHVVSL